MTLKDIAARLNIPESTVRYYRDSFSDFIPPAVGKGRTRRYDHEALEVIKEISDCFNAKLTQEETQEHLNSKYGRFIDVHEETQHNTTAITQADFSGFLSRHSAFMERQNEIMEALSKTVAEVEWYKQDKRSLEKQLQNERATRLRDITDLEARLERLEARISEDDNQGKGSMWGKLRTWIKGKLE